MCTRVYFLVSQPERLCVSSSRVSCFRISTRTGSCGSGVGGGGGGGVSGGGGMGFPGDFSRLLGDL